MEIGKALGSEDKANEVIAAYDAKLAANRDKIVQALGTDKKVAVVRPSDKDLQLFFPGFEYVSVVYNNLGLLPAESAVRRHRNRAVGPVEGTSCR